MTKRAHRSERALALDDLDAVIGGSASPMTYHPVAIQATAAMPGTGAGYSPIYTAPSAANNFGLANHLDLMFPGMTHDDGHAAQGMAPGVPGEFGAPGAAAPGPLHIDPSGAAAQDTQAHGGCHGAAGTDDHGTQASAPLSLVPGELGMPATAATSATAATDAATAPADAGAALYLGLPGGTDATHADTSHPDASHPATNDWAPGSFSDSASASSDTGW